MTTNNILNTLNRIERHYLTEVQLTFADRNGREMTNAELVQAAMEMRARRAR